MDMTVPPKWQYPNQSSVENINLSILNEKKYLSYMWGVGVLTTNFELPSKINIRDYSLRSYHMFLGISTFSAKAAK